MSRRELAGRVINLTDKPRPAFDVYIGRRQWCGKEVFEASPWANPFSVKKWGRQGAIKRSEEKLPGKPDLLPRHPELEGKILACWCKPKACHGDVLVRPIEERPVECRHHQQARVSETDIFEFSNANLIDT